MELMRTLIHLMRALNQLMRTLIDLKRASNELMRALIDLKRASNENSIDPRINSINARIN
jgi:hypothetical protein